MLDYLVDGTHRRVGKKRNGVLEQAWLYDGQLRPIAELDGASNLVSVFMYGEKSNVPEAMTKGGNTYRIVTDHLGSVRLVVDVSTGAIAQSLEYDAWGNVTSDSSPGFQPFGFAGGLYDRDLALVRFGARDYDPETGRWTSKDALRLLVGTNLYSYAQSQPVNASDPDGMAPTSHDECRNEGSLVKKCKCNCFHDEGDTNRRCAKLEGKKAQDECENEGARAALRCLYDCETAPAAPTDPICKTHE